MKSRIFLLSAFLVGITMLHPATAKADLLGDLLGGLFGGGSKGGNGGGTNLPINNGVLFLLIAGAIIGVVVLRKAIAKTTVAKA